MEKEASLAAASSGADSEPVSTKVATKDGVAVPEATQDKPSDLSQPAVTAASSQDNNEAGCGSSSWLNMSSWLSYAKEQSATVYQSTRSQSAHVWGFVKKDLGEFASTIKADTKAVYEQVRGSSGVEGNEGASGQQSDATQRLRSGISSLVSTVANAMYIPPDDSDEQALVVTRDGEVCAHDWEQSRIEALRSDPATFLADPQGQPEAFLAYLNEFDADSEQQEISQLLMSSSELRSLYSQMVPAELPHKHFWARYYYRVRAIRETARQRQELKRQAAAVKAAKDLDAISWDDEEDDEASVEKPADSSAAEASEAVADSLKFSERGDTVVVRHPASGGSSDEGANPTPSAPSTEQQQQQQQQQPAPSDLLDDDLDVDDVELTEEDLKKARELAAGVKSADKELDEDEEDLGEDDWGKWE